MAEMKRQGSDIMWFWIKHLAAAAILIVLAAVLLLFPEKFQTVTPQIAASSKTAAAEFTDFYEQIRFSLDATGNISEEFIVKLKDTSSELEQTLNARTDTVPPLETNWRGQKVQRRFQPGSKVRDEMTSYADSEGVELLWTLPRDYIVKHYFHTEGDYLSTLKEIATAIAPDFEKPILVYFCPNERAAVITDRSNEFMLSNCQRLNPEPGPKLRKPAAN
jgi:hypothetical protein